jgi:hypothetical protein
MAYDTDAASECWRGADVTSDVVGLIILRASVFFFPTSCDLLPLLTVMAQETRFRDSACAWRCERRGCGVCGIAAGWGPIDPLSLLKAKALWMVALRLVLLLEGAS